MVDGSHMKKCFELGLLTDDTHLIYCLQSSVEIDYPRASRLLFALILVNCVPKDPKHLWEIFKEYLAADFIHTAIRSR